MMLTAFSKKVTQINEDKNFVKYKGEPMIANEIVGNTLAKEFGLPVPGIIIGKQNNDYGVLYEEMKENYITGGSLTNRNNLYNYIESIYNKYHNVELVKDIFKVVIVDIIMGNPCRFQNTLLFNGDSLKLERVTGFAFSYLMYNDLKHPAIDGVMFLEKHGELYCQVLQDLPKLLDKYYYLQELLDKFMNLEMEEVLRECEEKYDIFFPSYLIDRALTHEVSVHKLIREKVGVKLWK